MRTLLFIVMSGALLLPSLSCNNGQRTDVNGDSTAAAPGTDMGEDYNQQLTYKQYSFSVNSKGQGALRQLTITGRDSATDLSEVNTPLEGNIYYASTADLNEDGRPEVYCFTRGTADSAGYSKVYAYAFDGKTGKPINFPELTSQQAGEYRGHDSIYIDEKYLVRSFSTDNSSAVASRKTIKYVLRPAADGFMLVQAQ
ncbi:MAG TPA: hypothetical protein VJ720_05620 [Chitinophaga sp.]|nr:hypothetical protein [Chitinophaga sp.]